MGAGEVLADEGEVAVEGTGKAGGKAVAPLEQTSVVDRVDEEIPVGPAGDEPVGGIVGDAGFEDGADGAELLVVELDGMQSGGGGITGADKDAAVGRVDDQCLLVGDAGGDAPEGIGLGCLELGGSDILADEGSVLREGTKAGSHCRAAALGLDGAGVGGGVEEEEVVGGRWNRPAITGDDGGDAGTDGAELLEGELDLADDPLGRGGDARGDQPAGGGGGDDQGLLVGDATRNGDEGEGLTDDESRSRCHGNRAVIPLGAVRRVHIRHRFA